MKTIPVTTYHYRVNECGITFYLNCAQSCNEKHSSRISFAPRVIKQYAEGIAAVLRSGAVVTIADITEHLRGYVSCVRIDPVISIVSTMTRLGMIETAAVPLYGGRGMRLTKMGKQYTYAN